MPISVKTLRRVVPLVAAALLAAGCSSTVPGAPATDTSASAGTSASSTENVFGNMEACQVLDQLLSGQSFDPGRNISKRNQCVASKSDFAAYGMALDPVQGLAEYKAQTPAATETTLNGRNALESQASGGMCEFALKVGEHARALAGVTMTRASQSAQACPLAQEFAEKLEPLLPKSQ